MTPQQRLAALFEGLPLMAAGPHYRVIAGMLSGDCRPHHWRAYAFGVSLSAALHYPDPQKYAEAEILADRLRTFADSLGAVQ